MPRIFLILCFSSIFLINFSQSGDMQRGEIRIKFKAPEFSLQELTRLMSIENVRNDTVFANVNNAQFQEFLKLKIEFDVSDNIIFQKNVRKSANQDYTFDYYPKHTEYVSFLNDLEFSHPSLCKVLELGQSVNKRDLYFIRINKDTLVSKPSVMFTSTMHGDETGGFVLMLRLADYLLNRYNSDPIVTYIIDNLDIWINPLANPDGTYGNSDEFVSPIRRNANGVDLNRSFPNPNTGELDVLLQPEIKAMIDILNKQHFVLSANFHSGAEVVNYPWDSYSKLHADNSWFMKVAQMYADTVKKYGRSSYFTSVSPSGIINGYEWYPINGGRQDYVTYQHQGREFTIELDNNYITPENELNDLWLYNYQSLLNLLNEATYGIHGVVKDLLSGKYIKAKIEILGHDDDNSFVFSDSSDGHFYRLIEHGTYSIMVSAEGYFSKLISNISLKNRSNSNVTVMLQKLEKTNEIESEKQFRRLYPNPTGAFLSIPFAINEKIIITDISGKVVLRTNPRSNILDVRSLRKGVYFLTTRDGWKQAFTKE